MFSSSKIGRFFGIEFFIHSTFWLVPLYVLFSGVMAGDVDGAVFDVAVLLAAFGCVALHEIGHSLAARSYGIGTESITLYPIGGIARLKGLPRHPWHEIVIALAGPAVNFVIATGLVAGMWAADLALPLASNSAIRSVEHAFLVQLFWVNVVLFLFNLIPAFPMDGGRVLRAFLTIPLGRLRATEIAATVGAVLAVLFFLAGLGLFGGEMQPMLMVLAVVLFLLGKAELMAVRFQEAKARWGRRGANPFVPAEDDFAEANGEDRQFSGWKWDPLRKVWTEWRDGQPISEFRPV